MHKEPHPRLNRKLELAELLDWLVADGLASAVDADKLKPSRVNAFLCPREIYRIYPRGHDKVVLTLPGGSH